METTTAPWSRFKQWYQRVMALLARKIHRTLSGCVFGRFVCSMFEQRGYDLTMSLRDGDMQGGSAVVCPCLCHIRAVVQQQGHGRWMLLFDCDEKRGLSVRSRLRHIRVFIQQQGHGRTMPIFSRDEEWGCAVRSRLPHVGAVGQQQRDNVST